MSLPFFYISYYTVVLYITDHKKLAKNSTLIPTSNCLHKSLAGIAKPKIAFRVSQNIQTSFYDKHYHYCSNFLVTIFDFTTTSSSHLKAAPFSQPTAFARIWILKIPFMPAIKWFWGFFLMKTRSIADFVLIICYPLL